MARRVVSNVLLLGVIAVTTLVIGAPIRAQSVGDIDLGGGLAVRRVPRFCTGGSLGTGCFYWEPVGFSFGAVSSTLAPAPPYAQPVLPFARTFARVPSTGRILASVGVLAGTPFAMSGFATRMLATDDLGAHWVPITWRWVESAASISFEPDSDDGVAAGDSGYVWTTTNGGTSWTDHGSSSGTQYIEALILDGVIVLLDSNGNVSRSDDHGFARQLIATDRGARLERRESDIIVHTSDADFRVRRGHGTERMRR